MLQPHFTPFPELSTERLVLRKITMEDLPDIFFLRSDPTIYQFLGKDPATDPKEAEGFIDQITKNIENNEGMLWGIVLKEAPSKVIGTICFWNLLKEHYRTEIGYALNPAYWRKGIMKEAILKVLDYGFEQMGLHSVEARLSSANIASAAVLESTGFVKEGYFKEDFFCRGKFGDTLVYSRLKK